MNKNIEYLVFDVETTGLPNDWKAPISKSSNWPRIVQIGWHAYDKQENLLESKSYIIKPDGFRIPRSSKKIHGISTRYAKANGSDIEAILRRFTKVIKSSKYVIAHNLNFDEKVVRSELLRAEIDDYFDGKTLICTQKVGTNVCKLPGKYGYKWPKLGELYDHLFEDNFNESHDALNDAKAAADCFFELKRRNAV
ncbi:MAG TPA: 3'-5' exonuclease [Balneolaceae bacterium]|nr:3'-5' exonuclease [Balneolaceae bacterium]